MDIGSLLRLWLDVIDVIITFNWFLNVIRAWFTWNKLKTEVIRSQNLKGYW